MTKTSATDPASPTYPSQEREREAQILARVQGGETEAFEMLVDQYERSVFGLMLRHGLDRDAAADMTQEAFLRAFRAVDQFRPERSSFKTWLFTIATNLVRDQGRRRKVRERGRERAEHEAELAPRPPTLEEKAAQRDQIDRLLSQLDEENRGLVVMRFLLDIPYAEMAEATGMAAATIRSRIHRSMKKLQALLPPPSSPGGEA